VLLSWKKPQNVARPDFLDRTILPACDRRAAAADLIHDIDGIALADEILRPAFLAVPEPVEQQQLLRQRAAQILLAILVDRTSPHWRLVSTF
jgi:hypothetical protein